jgi:hypothetical protein
MNFKVSAKQDEYSPLPARQRQTTHHSAHKKDNSNNGVDCSSSTSLQSQFITPPPDLHHFGPLKNVLQRRCFADGKDVKHGAREKLGRSSTACNAMVKKNVLIMETLRKINLKLEGMYPWYT